MPISSITDIDYEKIWAEQIKSFIHTDKAQATAYWDKRAATFGSQARMGSYTQDLIHRMALEPSDSLLDIGCGPGITTIPMAKCVRRITALDLSPAMLNILRQRAAQAGIDNITFINQSWEEAVIGRDIARHDVVLASRCLAGVNLAEGLQKLDRAARRSCYITWRAARSEGFEAEVFHIMRKPYHPHPEYPVILNTLYKLGISANLEIFSSTSEERYPGLEEAITNLARGEEINDDTRENLAALVERNFSHENGSYFRTSTTPWALIYWHKSEK